LQRDCTPRRYSSLLLHWVCPNMSIKIEGRTHRSQTIILRLRAKLFCLYFVAADAYGAVCGDNNSTAQKEQIINFINNSYPRKKACARYHRPPHKSRPSSSQPKLSATPSPPKNLHANASPHPRIKINRSCAKNSWSRATVPMNGDASLRTACRN